jgi:hypothetical protein
MEHLGEEPSREEKIDEFDLLPYMKELDICFRVSVHTDETAVQEFKRKAVRLLMQKLSPIGFQFPRFEQSYGGTKTDQYLQLNFSFSRPNIVGDPHSLHGLSAEIESAHSAATEQLRGMAKTESTLELHVDGGKVF